MKPTNTEPCTECGSPWVDCSWDVMEGFRCCQRCSHFAKVRESMGLSENLIVVPSAPQPVPAQERSMENRAFGEPVRAQDGPSKTQLTAHTVLPCPNCGEPGGNPFDACVRCGQRHWRIGGVPANGRMAQDGPEPSVEKAERIKLAQRCAEKAYENIKALYPRCVPNLLMPGIFFALSDSSAPPVPPHQDVEALGYMRAVADSLEASAIAFERGLTDADVSLLLRAVHAEA